MKCAAVKAGSLIISGSCFEGPTVLAAKKTFEGLRDLSPPAEAGLQDRGMRIQGGRREETGNSSQRDHASRHVKPGVGSILGGDV